jgi:putative ABC transport system permease protein
MSRMLITIQMAARSLVQHRRRSLFLAGALAGVTALLVLLNGIVDGVRNTMLQTATTLATGHVNVGGFFKVTAGSSAPVVTRVDEVLRVVQQAMPELRQAVKRGRGWAKLVADSGTIQAGINGIDIASEPDLRNVLRIIKGDLGALGRPNTILLFQKQADRLGVGVGDVLTISAQSTRGTSNTVDCQVVAIASEVGLLSQFNVYIPNATLRSLYQWRDDAAGVIQLRLSPDQLQRATQLAAGLRQSLETAGYRVLPPDPRPFFQKFSTVNREDWTGQKLDVTTWQDELSFLSWPLQALQGISTVLMFILITILVVGIMNTMWIAIRERTREIGTLRAIGMQRRSVRRLFLVESLLLGLAGTGVGALAGALIAGGLNQMKLPVPLGVQLFLMSDHLLVAVTPAVVLKAIVLLSLVTMLAALYPARRAARLKPIEAMGHFG